MAFLNEESAMVISDLHLANDVRLVRTVEISLKIVSFAAMEKNLFIVTFK